MVGDGVDGEHGSSPSDGSTDDNPSQQRDDQANESQRDRENSTTVFQGDDQHRLQLLSDDVTTSQDLMNRSARRPIINTDPNINDKAITSAEGMNVTNLKAKKRALTLDLEGDESDDVKDKTNKRFKPTTSTIKKYSKVIRRSVELLALWNHRASQNEEARQILVQFKKDRMSFLTEMQATQQTLSTNRRDLMNTQNGIQLSPGNTQQVIGSSYGLKDLDREVLAAGEKEALFRAKAQSFKVFVNQFILHDATLDEVIYAIDHYGDTVEHDDDGMFPLDDITG